MPRPILPLLDLVAICLVVFGLYLPRHRRGDMVVAYLVINIGVLSVAQVLDSRTASTGLGLGLFGLLSIIRLRSSDIDHQEVAYYFSSLALGLLGGLSASPDWLVPLLMAGIVPLLALILGVLYTHEVLIVGAHFDAVARAPGADDNGTGTAALNPPPASAAPCRITSCSYPVRTCSFWHAAAHTWVRVSARAMAC